MVNRVSLSLLKAGHCTHPQAATIRGGSLRATIFPALAALLRHPSEGWILFDTGYDARFFEATRDLPERLYRWLTPPTIAPSETVAAQLGARGIAPAEVRHVILSHFHGDHVAGVHHFTRATIHCARAGLQHVCARGRVGALLAGTPKGLLPPDLAERARFFEDAPRVVLPASLAPFEAGADLLGDGSLDAVELPGHCVGHWGLVVRTSEALDFLVADAAWSSEAIRRDVPPPRIVGDLLGDARAGRETLHRLHQLGRRNPELRMIPSHCAECAKGAV
jgi:glyoxylase-like metal-dependent hydrolase (beta-lactamase superfamily II)